AARDGISLVNSGEPIPAEVRQLIDDNRRPEDFERAVLLASVQGSKTSRDKPDEAYAIATRCCGGIEIVDGSPSVYGPLSNKRNRNTMNVPIVKDRRTRSQPLADVWPHSATTNRRSVS